METRWLFSDNTGYTEFAYHDEEEQSVEDFIEETLYILYRMEPVDRDWKKNLHNDWAFLAQYYTEPENIVEVDFDLHIVTWR